MSQADVFRQYADEAMRCAHQAQTEKEKQDLFDLAHTWTRAALRSEITIHGRGVRPLALLISADGIPRGLPQLPQPLAPRPRWKPRRRGPAGFLLRRIADRVAILHL